MGLKLALANLGPLSVEIVSECLNTIIMAQMVNAGRKKKQWCRDLKHTDVLWTLTIASVNQYTVKHKIK